MARTTVDDIRCWLERGQAEGASHTVVCTDTFSYEEYPVYVKPGQSAQQVIHAQQAKDMTQVRECYSHALDLEAQLQETRAWHPEPPTTSQPSEPPSPDHRRGRISPLADG